MVQATFWMKVGQRITYHRERAGLTRMELAEKLDLSVTSMFNIEMGVQGIKLDRAQQIARLCKCTLNDLVAGT